MASTFKTLADGDILRKALSILHNESVFLRTINKEYDDRFARSGAKNGGTLLIREPNQFTVRTGATMDSQDVTESTQSLVVATQKGVDVNFSSVDLTLSIDDFAERFLQPMMSRLAAEVEYTVINAVYKDIYKFENTTFGTKPVLSDVLAARAMLNKGLCPKSDRYLLLESLAANNIITAGYNIFNPADSISRQYKQGLLGQVYGFECNESEMTPTHTNGSRDDTTPVVNIATITNGDTTITTTGADGTIKAGDVFTIADVYDVNPETKAPYATLKQFVYTADHTNDATDVYSISPTIYKSGAKQNCYAASWSGAKAIVNVAAGGSGTAAIMAARPRRRWRCTAKSPPTTA